jgi:SAM-dependent methyltransferase
VNDPWNHNLHYHAVILDAIPAEAERALDAGCGEGTLARKLRGRIAEVVGIDRDEPSIGLARARGGGVEYVAGDLLAHPFRPASFDVVACVAAIHHVDMAAGLARLRDLVRPGGVLAVVGLARSRWPADLPYDVLSAITSRAHRLRRTQWKSPAPTLWPPPVTYAEARRIAEAVLPGVVYRRRPMWRYTLIWHAP